MKLLRRCDWSCAEYQQCVGTEHTVRRSPRGHREPLWRQKQEWPHQLWCDGTAHAKCSKKSGLISTFHAWGGGKVNEDSIVRPQRIKQQPGPTLTSVQILKLDTSQLTSCSLMMSHGNWDEQWSNEAITGRRQQAWIQTRIEARPRPGNTAQGVFCVWKNNTRSETIHKHDHIIANYTGDSCFTQLLYPGCHLLTRSCLIQADNLFIFYCW